MAEISVNDWSGVLSAPLAAATGAGGTVSVAPLTPGLSAGQLGSQARARIGTEIVTVTLTTATSWTIVAREAEDATRYPKQDWPAGTLVDLVLTAAGLTALASVPVGGAINTFLKKQSAADYDDAWFDLFGTANVWGGTQTFSNATIESTLTATVVVVNDTLTVNGLGIRTTQIHDPFVGSNHFDLDASNAYISSGGGSIITDAAFDFVATVGGALKVRQAGGTIDVDQLDLSHDGLTATLRNRDTGGLRVRNAADTVTTWSVDDAGNVAVAGTLTAAFDVIGQNRVISGNVRFELGQLQFTNNSSQFTGPGLAAFNNQLFVFGSMVSIRDNANANTVATFTPGTGVQFEKPLGFAQGVDPATVTDVAHVYTKDVAGTAEMFVRDEAGNVTQLSPHATDAPATLYDAADPHPFVVKEVQQFLGSVRYLNVGRTCYLLEGLLKAIAQGQTLAEVRTFLQAKGPGFIDCFRVETFAQHNQRTGAALTRLNWSADQARLQTDYDAARAAELAAHADWLAADPADRGAEPSVRPAADVRKAIPAWLAARGAT